MYSYLISSFKNIFEIIFGTALYPNISRTVQKHSNFDITLSCSWKLNFFHNALGIHLQTLVWGELTPLLIDYHLNFVRLLWKLRIYVIAFPILFHICKSCELHWTFFNLHSFPDTLPILLFYSVALGVSDILLNRNR